MVRNWLAPLLLLSLFGFRPLSGQEANWKVGLARVKITPEQPVFMAGYASRDRPFASVHDDLYAKALVLADASGTRAVLVTTDLIGLTAEIADPIRQRIEEQTGIPATSVLLSSSHTHTGPALSLDPKPDEGRALADSERTVAYTKSVQDKLVQVVADAAELLQPARLSWSVGVVHFVMNRREYTVDRGIILGVNPRGQADRSVPVLRIDGPDGQPRAIVFGAASHNTTLGPRDYEISGDYAGHAQRLIEEKLPGTQAMFVLGCAGDANPYPRGTHEIAAQHGQELATEVLRVAEDKPKLAPVHGPLRVAWGQATLPLAAAPPREELQKQAAGKSGTGPWIAQQMLARLDRGEKLPTEYTCPLAVWQLGEDLTLVALSGEVVVDYVRLLEDALGPGQLWVAAYCHDVYGYLPSARVLKQGGYETRGLYSGGIGTFMPEAEGVLVRQVAELAAKAGRKVPGASELPMKSSELRKAVRHYASFDEAARTDVGGAVSFWLNTNRSELWKSRFCDPVQITAKGANNGGIWFDFNDAQPRDTRIGVFPGSSLTEGSFREFLHKHCFACHDDDTAEAKLSLESLPLPVADFTRWVPVFDKLRTGQMPPPGEPQPTPEARRRVSDWLRQCLHDASLAQQQTEGRVVLRRLNRTEYVTTLRDLLGRQVDVKELLPSDNVAAGFDNVSAVLDVSSAHLLRYQDAAEKALATVIPRQPQQPFHSKLTGRQVFEKSKQAQGMNGKSLRLDGDTLVLCVRPWTHIAIGTATVPQTGRYRVRASLQAVNTEGRPLPVRFTAGWDWGRSETAVREVRDAPADKPVEIEFEVVLSGRELIDLHAWSLPTERQLTEQKDKKPLDQLPGLAIGWLEIEGPLDPWPPAGYTRLFGDLPLKSQYKGGPLYPASDNPRADADRLLRDFLPVAFRRPVSPELHDYYLQIVLAALDQKQSFEDAMLLGYRAALCSPHFLFLAEPIQAGAEPGRLDDYAVAARLSYFLWSTLPDRELLDLAARGELTRPDELRLQVERLLADPRAQRFAENFAGQWLDLRQINATTPDPEVYGEFDDFLYWSMPRETTRFFDEVLQGDRSLTEFVQSDWTFLNERLAQHYGVPGVFGGELRRVTLPPGSHRGGVLTQASILKVTADGTKTSPVLRGTWVLERILGLPPKPPPPNVAAIDPDIRGATTIREQLDKHRNIQSCAACHRHIDPPGFALESFDVIGGWREFYRATAYNREAQVELPNYPGRRFTRGPAIDCTGETAGGAKFRDIDEYKALLLADQDQLARNLAEKLLIYATGADIQFADREVVEQLVAQSREKHYGFRSLIHSVVQSRVFLRK